MKKNLINICMLAIAVIVYGALVSLPVMFLWNYALVSAIAGISQISWLQAWAIMILFGILFRSSISKDK